MNLKEAIIKKIDELILEGEEVARTSSYARGFEIGEIKAVYSGTQETTQLVLVLGTSIPLKAQDATAIYGYLANRYYERLEKENNRKREEALKYLGIS